MNLNPHAERVIAGLEAVSNTGLVSAASALTAIQAQATLALAYEQRTANLIALLQHRANPATLTEVLQRLGR